MSQTTTDTRHTLDELLEQRRAEPLLPSTPRHDWSGRDLVRRDELDAQVLIGTPAYRYVSQCDALTTSPEYRHWIGDTVAAVDIWSDPTLTASVRFGGGNTYQVHQRGGERVVLTLEEARRAVAGIFAAGAEYVRVSRARTTNGYRVEF